ncbi:MAG: alpha/beta fold hydrolase [Alphaproteobacteria bacterium]|nr:alpha/beta fold hydrolase [Alphaproteobacteria bacterium]
MPTTSTRPHIAWEARGDGPPVLLVMGFGMRGVVWRPVVTRLAVDHRAVTFDNRGMGASDPADGPYSLADLARDTLRVADDAGLPAFHLVGVSMGGMIAQEVALAAPDRVRSLVLIATQPGGPRAWVPPLPTVPLLAAIGLGTRLNRRLFPRLLHPPGSLDALTPADLEQRWTDAHATSPDPRQRRLQLRAIRGHDTRDRLGSIAAPTLVVKPLRDRMCHPSHSDTLVAGIPGARLLELDAGHGLILHAADALTEAIRDHVATAGRTPA